MAETRKIGNYGQISRLNTHNFQISLQPKIQVNLDSAITENATVNKKTQLHVLKLPRCLSRSKISVNKKRVTGRG